VQSAFPDHFALFGLEPRFSLDAEALALAHRQLLARVHPDRHVLADAASRRAAMQWASRANEAFETLSQPSARASYLCALRGAPVEIDGSHRMPPDLLNWLMQWREELEEAREAGDAQALERLGAEAQGERGKVEAALAQALDGRGAWSEAGDLVRRLVFAEKLCAEAREAVHGTAADL
jgi:molecular chaperone HscB